MRQQKIYFSEAKTLLQCYAIAPWAAVILETDGCFIAFESVADANTFENQL